MAINDRLTRMVHLPENATTTAYVKSLVVSATPASLCGLSGYNSNASIQYIQIHDAASLPSNGAYPVVSFPAGATSKFALDYGANPRQFTTGIVVCISSTQNTLTLGATADTSFDVQFKQGIM